jgi:hypothetical protein
MLLNVKLMIKIPRGFSIGPTGTKDDTLPRANICHNIAGSIDGSA